MNLDQARAFIQSQRWMFAKTMPRHPHEYIVRDKVQNDEAFDALVMLTREQGEARTWGRRTFTYLRIDDHDYWTMGAPVAETIIINRAKV